MEFPLANLRNTIIENFDGPVTKGEDGYSTVHSVDRGDSQMGGMASTQSTATALDLLLIVDRRRLKERGMHSWVEATIRGPCARIAS